MASPPTRSKILTVSLFLGSFFIIVGGLYTVLDPHGFYAQNGASLGDDINLVNCVRATGAMLFTFGAVIFSGLFLPWLRFASSVLAATFWPFYASGRLTGILVDGRPSDELIRGTTIEVLVATLVVIALFMRGSSSEIQEMSRTRWLTVVLSLSGAMMFVFGAATVVAPQFLYGLQQVELGYDVNIVNFARAQGAAFMGCGIVILAGIFIRKLTFASTVIATAVFTAFGVGRAISLAVDGVAAPKLVQGTFIELTVGVLALAALHKHWRR